MRILLISQIPPGLGGQQIYVKNLSQYLIKKEIPITILTVDSRYQKGKKIIRQNIPTIYLAYKDFFINRFRNLGPFVPFIKFIILNQKNYDIIHVQSYEYLTSLFSIAFSKFVGIPSVLTLHGNVFQFSDLFNKWKISDYFFRFIGK
ncbi:MAG: glycosyltransferase, partial [Candidatus Helarchaeota archaeon]